MASTHSVELLSPAGNLEKLKTVLQFGADAVYLGGKAFNLRAGSSNFSMDGLKEAVDFAHALNKRVYVTLNIIAHNRDVKGLPNFVKYLEEIGVDAVIAADIGVMGLVKEYSNLPIHVSTQASTANWMTAKQYYQMGAKRVVLARELSLDEIKSIKDKVPELELEVFVHGAMCMTYSGRCTMSSYMTQRDSNHGMCANSCRWKYALVEEKRPGVYYPVYEDETGNFMYNSKDLCTIDFLDKIVEAGVSGLKIEGRNRGVLYGATTTKVYREATDLILSKRPFEVSPEWIRELDKYRHRGYTTGFFHGKLDRHAQRLDGITDENYVLAGVVKEVVSPGVYHITARNKFVPGQELESVRPQGISQKFSVTKIVNPKNGKEMPDSKPGYDYIVTFDTQLEPLDLLRVKSPEHDLDEN
ncbi:MAG: U32 family peptidase [Proteobacteria bacterium]|nr:U32 family peptidase [Pseudomonadota bacterium]